jgi:hypothetical protein
MTEYRFGTGRLPESAAALQSQSQSNAAPTSVLPQNVHPSLRPTAKASFNPMTRIAAPTSPAMAAATVPTSPSGLERTEYGAGGGRKTAFSFLMLLLLPFFASLPVMIYQRVNHGLWFDTWQLVLVAAVFGTIMFLVLIELLFSLRAYLSLGKSSVRFTLPSGRGPTPMLRYASHDIPYHAIKSVEVRREVFGGALAPVMLRGAVIRTKDEREITLGFVSEANVDPAFPYPLIAEQIARRAGLSVSDQGTVWRRDGKGRQMGFMSGSAHTRHIADHMEIEALNKSHRRLVLGLVNVLVLLVMLGIAADYLGS